MNQSPHPARLARLALLVLSLATFSATAQITNIWTNTTSGTWSDALNWTNGVPISATNTAVLFTASGATTYRATNTVANFLLNRMVFDSSSANRIFSVGTNLIFRRSGANFPQILQNNSGGVTISNFIASETNIIFAGTGTGDLLLTGIISSNINIVKMGNYVLTLTGANTFGGTGRGVTNFGGTIAINADARLGVTNNSITLSSNSTLRTYGSFTTVRAITTGTGGGRIEVTNGTTLTVSGTHTFSALTKDGAGTLQITTTGTGNGRVTNNAGTVRADLVTAFGNNTANTVLRLNAGTYIFNYNALTASAISNELAGGVFAGTRGVIGNDFAGVRNVTGPIRAITGTTSTIRLDDAVFAGIPNNLRITGPVHGDGALFVTSPLTNGGTIVFTNTVTTFTGDLTLGTNITAMAWHTNATPIGAARNITLMNNSQLLLRYNTTNQGNSNINFYLTNSLHVLGNALLDVRRQGVQGATNTNSFAALTLSNAIFSTTGANAYQVKFISNATLHGTATFDIQTANVSLDANVVEGTTNSILRKSGAGTLFITNYSDSTYSGGTIVQQGTLNVVAGSNSLTTQVITNPLGTGDITLQGGNLTIRADTNLVIGPGAGHAVHVYSNATLNVDRLSTNGGTGRVLTMNTLHIHSNAVFNAANGNGYFLRFQGPAFVETNFALGPAGQLSLDAGIIETNGSGFSFDKRGGGTVFLTNFSTNIWTGTTYVSQGTLRLHIDTNNNTFAAGVQPSLVLQGGTLDVRSSNSITFGPGPGYNLVVNSNATMNVQRYIGALADRVISVNNLNVNNGAQFTTAGADTFIIRVNGTTTLNGPSALNIGNTRTAAINLGSLELLGDIADGATNGTLIKRGTQVLNYGLTNNPTFSGGTLITAGQVAWQVPTLAPGSYRFGTGPIRIDGGSGSSFAFRGASNGTYTILNNFIINSAFNVGGIFGAGGGQIDFARLGGNNPTVTATGTVDLRGQLFLAANTGNAGSATPGTLTGPVLLSGGDRTIQVLSSGLTGNANNRFIISGNITADVPGRTLSLIANNGAGLELSGTNTSVASMIIKPSYQGATGRVRFANTNALPSGLVTVEPGAFVGVGFNPAVYGTNLASLGAKFNLQAGSAIGLDLVTNRFWLDFGPTGLNQDVRVGVSGGFTSSNLMPITPFGSIYKLGGGNGTLVLTGTNQLTGASSLNAFPDPTLLATFPVASGSLNLNNSNSYTGGTVVNPAGTLNVLNSNTLGTGRVDLYGIISVTGNPGSLLETASGGLSNVNQLVTHAGSTLAISYNNATLNFNRFGDSNALALNSSSFTLTGRAITNVASSETIGSLIVGGGSALNVNGSSSNGSTLTLTAESLARNGAGTLQITHTAATNMQELGLANRFLVSNNAPVPVNGMVAPWIVNQTSNTFLTYTSDGFTNVTYTSTDLNTALPTDLVLNGTNPVTVTSDRTFHALRSSGVILGTNVLTIGSGGLLSAATHGIFTPLNFHDGTNAVEALIYVNGTLTNNAQILNAAGITKFGDGNLLLNIDQATYSNGWNLNRGTLTLTAGSSNGLGLGATSPSNVVRLNGNTTFSITSGSNITFSSGPIIARDYNNNITANFGGGNNADRTQTFAPLGLTMDSDPGSPLGSLMRVNLSQNRSILRVGGPVTLNSDAAFNIVHAQVTGGSNRFVFAGGLVGSNRNITKFGNGALAITTDNSATYQGNIQVNGGVLVVGHNGALGNALSTATINSNTVLEILGNITNYTPTSTIIQKPGSAERWMSQFTHFADMSNVVTETVIMGTNVHLQLSASLVNVTNKVIRFNGGTLEAYQFIDDARAAAITIGRDVSLELAENGRIGHSGVDTGRAGVSLTVNANIADFGGARSLTKIGPDTVILGAQNTYTGGTVVNQGTLRLGTNDGLLPSRPLLVEAAGTFDIGGFNQTVTGFNGTGTITNSGTNKAFTVAGSGSNVFTGLFQGNIDLVKTGFGSLTLNNSNSISGGNRQINEGIVYLDGTTTGGSSPLGLPSSPVVLLGVATDAQLLTRSAITVPQPVTVASFINALKVIGAASAHESTFSGNFVLADTPVLTAPAGARVNFTGNMVESGGNFGLTKQGEGIVTISGSNTFTTGVSVQAGTLLVNNLTGSGTGSGNVLLNPFTTLGGTGRIGGSAVIGDDGENGSRLTPGDPIGVLRIDGNLDFAPLASVTFDIGGLIRTNNYDGVSVGGNVAFGGSTLFLSLTNSFWPSTNNVFTLIDYGSNAGDTRFGNALHGARVTTTDTFGSFKISYSSTNVVADGFLYLDNTGDGIYDAWSFKYFGLLNLAGGVGATQKFGDFDGDGMNNYQEFIAGMNPTNSDSRHEMTAATVSGTANFAVQWTLPFETTFRTPAYQIQYSSDLVSWTTITPAGVTIVPVGLTSVYQWIDDGSQTGGTPPLDLGTPRFYRVKVQ